MRSVSSSSSSSSSLTSAASSSILPKRRAANASVAPIFTAEQRQSAIDEQTHLINPALHRPVYTPPPSSPTHVASRSSPSLSSAAGRHSPSSIALVESRWQQADTPSDRPMDSTPLTQADAYDDDEAAAAAQQPQQHSPHWQRSPRANTAKVRLKQPQHKEIDVVSSSPSSHDTPSPSDSSLSALLRESCSKRGVLCLLILTAVIVTAVAVPLLYLHFRPSPPQAPPFSPYTTCDIFCTGPVLSAFQLAHLFNDSKTFVDLPLRSSPSEVYAHFMQLSNLTLPSLRAFLHQHFDTNTSDLLPWQIPDWQPAPPVLDSVSDPTFRNFTAELNRLWFKLGRELHPDVYAHPERHTLLPLAQPYMVVPGGRFREFYYWDSYWIVRGLLLCGMNSTARMVIDNLLHMVHDFGFVPNGSRQYYLTRSQPPFLALMVDYYHNATGDDRWLRSVLPLLSREYEYWMKEDEHAIALQDSSNRTYWLNRYYASVQYPRPESYAEDVATARHLSQAAHGQRYKTTNASSSSDPRFPASPVPCENSTDPDCDTTDQWSPQAKLLFSELTASAETGWDFSSRWFADRRNLSSAETSRIIPVDLNAVLYAVERVLSKLHNKTDDSEQGLYYALQAQQRLDGMYALLFDSSAYVWRDLDFVSGVQDGYVALASNYVPLWTAAYDRRVDVSRVIDGLLASRLLQPGGLLTSLDDIDQQWDCPNAWPPLQHMVFEGIGNAAYTPSNQTVRDALTALSASLAAPLPAPYSPLPLSQPASPHAASLAYYLSSSWLYGNAALFNSTRTMYEKYYALTRGTAGAGGEYEVQEGFGWSNGVALILLQQYGSILNWTQVGSLQPPFEMSGYPCTANPSPPPV